MKVVWLRQSEQSLLGVSRPVAIELCSLLKGLAFYSNWTGDTLWGFKQKNARITLTAVWRTGYWRREVRTEGPGCPGVGWRWLWEYWGIEPETRFEDRAKMIFRQTDKGCTRGVWGWLSALWPEQMKLALPLFPMRKPAEWSKFGVVKVSGSYL